MPISDRPPDRLTARRAAHGALLLAALTALSAHVSVEPGEVRANSSQRFTVRVPTERPEPTIRLRLELPAGLGTPRIQSKPPWTYELEKDASGTVTAISWSGGEIGPDEYDEFHFTARTPAQPGPLAFKAEQTYKSGEVVAWAGPPGDARPAAHVEVRDSTFGMAPAVSSAAEGEGGASAATGAGGAGWMTMLALALSVLAVVLAMVGLSRRA